MDFKSVYYDSFEAAMLKYDISPEAAPFAAPQVQSTEEMFFAWTNFLIS